MKGIISKSLSFGFIQEGKHYATKLFEIEPTNPTVPQDLIEIYLDNKQPDLLLELFKELIDKNKSEEVLGNLNFHLGLLYFNIDNETESAIYINKAKEYFQKVLPKDHHVFKSIEEFERMKHMRNTSDKMK